jgi:hypothetical protein
MGVLIDLSGQRFGFLTVVAMVPRTPGRNTVWICRCDCGNEARVQVSDLRSAGKRSCGCKRGELIAAKVSRHGHWAGGKASGEWTSWRAAITRCHNPKSKSFARYGGSGVVVCAEWRESFDAFYRELGPRPAGATLDRIDGARGYEPGNCEWSTPKQQSNHLKNNRFVLVAGQRMTIRDASDKFGLPYAKFRRDLYRRGEVLLPSGNLVTMLHC